MTDPEPGRPILSSHRTPFQFKASSTRERSHSPSTSYSFSYPPVDPLHDLEQATHSVRTTIQPHRHSHKRKRRRSLPALQDHTPDIDPETAFRESLFDAMADDEGAEFWSRTYGTPVDIFDRTILERMGEEEYASFVRTQMWQRTSDYRRLEKQREEQDRAAAKLRKDDELRAARRRRKQADRSERKKEEIRSDWGKHREDWDNETDAVLRTRASRKVDWDAGWQRYLRAWQDLGQPGETFIDLGNDPFSSLTPRPLQFLLCYPVLSGQRRDITSDAVSEFLQNCPRSFISDAPNRPSGKNHHAHESSLSSTSSTSRNIKKMRDVEAVLKAERLRWHPDKIQQRFGPKYSDGVDMESMKTVTEVFRIVDGLLGRIRVKLEFEGKVEERRTDHSGDGPYRYW